MSADWINIGFIRRPHGLRGYVRVEALSDAPGRYEELDRIEVELVDGRRETLKIENSRADGNNYLMKFLGINTAETAERLRSAYIQVPEEDVAALPKDAYYVYEIEGCTVVTEDGELVGKVREVMSMPAHDVFVLDSSQGEVMIPMVKDLVVEIKPEDSKIVVRPIPGLIS